jgi:outer membrane protein assembly factor BamD
MTAAAMRSTSNFGAVYNIGTIKDLMIAHTPAGTVFRGPAYVGGSWRTFVVLLTAVLALAGCGAKNKKVLPKDTAQPDQFLFERGNEALMKERWLDAREYFKQVVDNYPGSPLRADAKLGVADTYLGEGGTANLILGANEYREFLTFYPTHPKADYAQFKLAMTHHKQMRTAARDQTETRDALKEFETFFDRFPTSPLMPEVRMRWREARDRLSEATYLVGLHYYRSKWYLGALSRFQEVLKDDPGYTHRDDVYFYLGETFLKARRKEEAVVYFDRLVKEFEVSEHLEEAKKRLAELQPPAELKTQ